MDINPLIVGLDKYRDELIDTISIAISFRELNKADVYIANDIAEIKGKRIAQDPFQQVADLYSLPRKEVVKNIRNFANKCFKTLLPGDPKMIKDIEFDESEKQLPHLLAAVSRNASE